MRSLRVVAIIDILLKKLVYRFSNCYSSQFSTVFLYSPWDNPLSDNKEKILTQLLNFLIISIPEDLKLPQTKINRLNLKSPDSLLKTY